MFLGAQVFQTEPSRSCFDTHSVAAVLPRPRPPPLAPDSAAFLHVNLISHVSPTKEENRVRSTLQSAEA